MTRLLLEVNGVWKRLCRRPEKAVQYALADIGRDVLGRPPGRTLRDGEFWALRNVDFEIESGEVIGVIGHNGAGKSTLINIVSGIILPTLGSVAIHTGRVAVVDQSGGLNPIETGRENAITQLALHGVPDNAIADELAAIEAFAEIGDFIDAPVGTYSLGMRLRLAFSIYTRLKPELFIIDEALGGGDLRFRNKFRGFLRSYVDGGGAILLCSHEMAVIQTFCHRCMLLDQGRIMMSGPPVMMIDSYHELMREREREAAKKRAAGPVAAGKDSTRSSTPELCRIESIGLVAEDGGHVRPGTNVVIEVVIVVSEEIEGVSCGIEIGRGEMLAIATIAVGYSGTPVTLRPPQMTLRCRIERLPLAPGDYEMRVGVTLPKAGVSLATSGYEDAAAKFAVVPPMNALSNLTRWRQNIVHMETEWQIVAAEATQDAFEAAGRSGNPMPEATRDPVE